MVTRPCAVGFSGNYPRALDGLARLLSLDMRVIDPAWIGMKLRKLLNYAEPLGWVWWRRSELRANSGILLFFSGLAATRLRIREAHGTAGAAIVADRRQISPRGNIACNLNELRVANGRQSDDSRASARPHALRSRSSSLSPRGDRFIPRT